MTQNIKIYRSTTSDPTSLDFGVPAVSFTGGRSKLFIGNSLNSAVEITDASNIKNTPAGNVVATTVQAAIDELDSEKYSVGGALGTPSSGSLTNCTGLPVTGGGTGQSSLTPYAPLFGGTTGSGAIQSGAVGTSGQILTSNGSGSLPTFQNNPAGTIVQIQRFETAASATGTGTIVADDTIPQSNEGIQFLSHSITPTNSGNKLRIEITAFFSVSVANFTTNCGLFQDSISNAIASGWSSSSSVATSGQIFTLTHEMTAGTTSPTTFKLRAGMSTSGTVTFNGFSGSRKFGGTFASSITITEIQV